MLIKIGDLSALAAKSLTVIMSAQSHGTSLEVRPK